MSSNAKTSISPGWTERATFPASMEQWMWGNKADHHVFMASKLQINDGPANGKLPEGIGIVISYSRVVGRR
jgi:hypothetical protein